MALKDFFASIGDKLEETFNSKPRDPVKARQPLLKGIDNALDQHENGRTKVPNRWWSVSNDVVAFSPKLKGVPLVINGKTTNYIPSNRFGEFLDVFKEEVQAGDFDAMILAIEDGTGNAGSSVPVPVPTRRGGGRGSITPEAAKERGRRAAATRAANKAARAAEKA